MEEALVKRLTGQDKIVCRDLYSSFFEYVPTFKFVLATNSKPIIHGTDHAIWRRIHLIPFRVIVPPERQDKQLIEKLRLELPGILNWVLEGVGAYLHEGLSPPKCVLDATLAYRSEMDVLAQWIEEQCVINPAAATSVDELFRSYDEWCSRNKYRALSKRGLGDQLADRGYKREKVGGKRSHVGLALRR